MTITDLLDDFGTAWIDIRELRGGEQPPTDGPLQIGRNYAPPMGALSVIDEDRVAPPSHRHKLEAAGYNPSRVASPPASMAWPSRDRLRHCVMVVSLVLGTLVALVIVLARRS